MRPPLPKPQRCAIYTRKSTEHNLDLAFNSLDAQREACEAYIKSQAHEGWRCLPDCFNDGGLSGASLERPALQELLTLVQAGGIDVIVVYKVDRLTRSLADFAKLVDLFDRHGVSFVSVTQSFNTTSSMGRLTLNVLLSFAQFEREVIGERVRDKIAASKRKGIWVGGPVPLGYRSVNKKLVAEATEAEIVRTIFRRYLAVRSVGLLSEDLAGSGVRPRNAGVERFAVGPLAYLLKNRIYIGEVVYRGEVHKGEHEPILDRDLFDQVQAVMRDQAVERRNRRARSPSFLSGLLHDDRGNRMSPGHANKRGVRYRYYVSQALLQNRKAQAGSVTRVSAPDLETLVVTAVKRDRGDHPATDLSDADRDLVVRHVQRVILRPDCVEIMLRGATPDAANLPVPSATGAALAGQGCVVQSADAIGGASGNGIAITDKVASLVNGPEPQTIVIPWRPAASAARKGIAWEPSQQRLAPAARDALLAAIARARIWLDDLIERRVRSLADIAAREGKGERHIQRLLRLACLSPKVIAAIADGVAPADLTVTGLAAALPHRWADQERRLGLC